MDREHATAIGKFVRLFALMSLLSMPRIASAEEFVDGVNALNRGQYEAAMEILTPLAEQGNATAQYDIGTMYDKGQGVEQDYGAAAGWFMAAAEGGYAAAQNDLGRMYYLGQGVEKDYKLAVTWFTKAAERGNVDAQAYLGKM